jgi:polyphosphate kinase 2 (PPK2 family)
MKERARWDEYQQAYEDAVNATSTPWAPWYVTIPGEASVRLAATREQWSRRSMNARPGQ